jgi:N-acylneuraminate cytidylyltransferase
MNSNRNICVIPARGGSKRLPGKNIKEFFGKPVVAYAIHCAQECQLFDQIIVSTDSIEIAELAKAYGADVPFFRSTEASDDHATTMEVLAEVVEMLDERGDDFQNLLCLYPVTPLVQSSSLIQGFTLLQGRADGVVFPVLEYKHPIWRALQIENGMGRHIWVDKVNDRTQDLGPTFHDAGQWYWMRLSTIRRGVSFSALNLVPVPTSESLAQDVDTIEDWEILEVKYQRLFNER